MASHNFKDLTGQRFGRLTVCEKTDKRQHGSVIWLCSCSCGADVEAKAGNLKSGNTKSCGCHKKDILLSNSVTHGHARAGNHTPEYTTWVSMRNRCKYPSTAAYPWYGGRGISVCDRWQGKSGYLNFLNDMGSRPGKGWSIDRVDPDDDYKPSNCRWLPMSENASRAHTVT